MVLGNVIRLWIFSCNTAIDHSTDDKLTSWSHEYVLYLDFIGNTNGIYWPLLNFICMECLVLCLLSNVCFICLFYVCLNILMGDVL